MLLLEAKNLHKRFGVQDIFTIDTLAVHEGDRIGLVGMNGAGKSTLLSVLADESAPDGGTVRRLCDITVIQQDGTAGGTADAHTKSLLGLRASACKSGGERTRLAIASAFSENTPLLFADEPTTNLDTDGIDILQGLLLSYSGALLLVSHDRALLDAVCTQIWSLEGGTLHVFPGTYTDFMQQQQRERDFAQFEYDQYRAEQARLRDEVRSIHEKARGMNKTPKRMGNSEARLHRNFGVKAKQGKVQSRIQQLESRLDHLEVKERPRELPEISMPLGASSPVRAKLCAQVENITVRHGTRTVLDQAALVLPTGSRTVLLGANGAGKTTLVRALLAQGRFSQGVSVGYFAQDHETLDPKQSVLQNARADSDLPEHVVRTILANLYLGAQEITKPAAVLSGGERAKVQLARLLAARVHLLILDEPTNHLDVYTLEALETMLTQWQGTLLVVTHDRRMAAKIATRIVRVQDGCAEAFDGDFAAWETEQTRRAHPRDGHAERRALLEVRIAAANARLSCPQKGDNPAALLSEWEQLMEEYRSLRE